MPFFGNRYQGQQLCQANANPNHLLRGHTSSMTISGFWLSRGSMQQCLQPLRDLAACDLNDRRDIDKEIWPSIYLNISSDTVHYKVIYFPKCSQCAVKRKRCNCLKKKFPRKVLFESEMLNMYYLIDRSRGLLFLQVIFFLLSICSRRFYCP